MILLLRRAFSFRRLIMSPPDRWEVYQPMGSIIPGTKFIAFKVPLKEELLKRVEEKDRFSPSILIKLLDDQGLKLGGVIDLTFTFKYYNREEFIKNSIGHKKVFVAGHVVPSESVFQEFAHAVKGFDTGDDGHIIGVHCTHGVNRTGYLICRYMIEEMDYEPDDAIALFGKARGHELERENYLQDLRNRKRGQSSYDPNFKVQDVDTRTGRNDNQNPPKEKPRWRNQKADHPEWRRKYHHSAQDDRSEHLISPLDALYQGNPQSAHQRNQWAPHEAPSGYFEDRTGSVDIAVHGDFSRCSRDRFLHGGSNPNWRNSYARNNPAFEGFNSNLAQHNYRGSYHNSYRGNGFNPIYSYRRSDRDRIRSSNRDISRREDRDRSRSADKDRIRSVDRDRSRSADKDRLRSVDRDRSRSADKDTNSRTRGRHIPHDNN